MRSILRLQYMTTHFYEAITILHYNTKAIAANPIPQNITAQEISYGSLHRTAAASPPRMANFSYYCSTSISPDPIPSIRYSIV